MLAAFPQRPAGRFEGDHRCSGTGRGMPLKSPVGACRGSHGSPATTQVAGVEGARRVPSDRVLLPLPAPCRPFLFNYSATNFTTGIGRRLAVEAGAMQAAGT